MIFPNHLGVGTQFIKSLMLGQNKKWLSFFKISANDPDTEWHFMDGSYVKAHQHSSGAATLDTEAIGENRAGNTSEIHLAVNGYELPIEFILMGAKFRIALLPHNSLRSCKLLTLSLRIKAMIVRQFVNLSIK